MVITANASQEPPTTEVGAVCRHEICKPSNDQANRIRDGELNEQTGVVDWCRFCTFIDKKTNRVSHHHRFYAKNDYSNGGEKLKKALEKDDLWEVERVLSEHLDLGELIASDALQHNVSAMLLRPLDVTDDFWKCELMRGISEYLIVNFLDPNRALTQSCAMLLELRMSTPTKDRGTNGWTLQPCDTEVARIHFEHCVGYPWCLLQCWRESFDEWNFTSKCLENLTPFLVLHSGTTIDKKRRTVRLLFVVHTNAFSSLDRRMQSNIRDFDRRDDYLSMVRRLHLPPDLYDFLVFKELWPASSLAQLLKKRKKFRNKNLSDGRRCCTV
ncbi:hypothetical protein CLF_112735 [Clonorchis sinensis]|uniref:SOCS box domain-containing protein n=1 Tax=Clonorchis sinensis TaxID=79923 RepID=G7YMP2_CLOSI|nr:hypothetical protein CLF_112735 [Clonorchis sinensis]